MLQPPKLEKNQPPRKAGYVDSSDYVRSVVIQSLFITISIARLASGNFDPSTFPKAHLTESPDTPGIKTSSLEEAAVDAYSYSEIVESSIPTSSIPSPAPPLSVLLGLLGLLGLLSTTSKLPVTVELWPISSLHRSSTNVEWASVDGSGITTKFLVIEPVVVPEVVPVLSLLLDRIGL